MVVLCCSPTVHNMQQRSVMKRRCVTTSSELPSTETMSLLPSWSRRSSTSSQTNMEPGEARPAGTVDAQPLSSYSVTLFSLQVDAQPYTLLSSVRCTASVVISHSTLTLYTRATQGMYRSDTGRISASLWKKYLDRESEKWDRDNPTTLLCTFVPLAGLAKE